MASTPRPTTKSPKRLSYQGGARHAGSEHQRQMHSARLRQEVDGTYNSQPVRATPYEKT